MWRLEPSDAKIRTFRANAPLQKGKRINTLIADDIEWTYLPGTKADATDEDAPDTDGGGTDNGGNNNSGGGDFVG